jgi:hypothetical protein
MKKISASQPPPQETRPVIATTLPQPITRDVSPYQRDIPLRKNVEDDSKSVISDTKTVSSRMPGFMGGMMKKDMKNFMKQALAKTKEEGNSGTVVIGSGSGYKKVNHFAPKTKKDEKKKSHPVQ